jgi:hypothetical protein
VQVVVDVEWDEDPTPKEIEKKAKVRAMMCTYG